MFPKIHLAAIFLRHRAQVGELECWYNVMLLGYKLGYKLFSFLIVPV